MTLTLGLGAVSTTMHSTPLIVRLFMSVSLTPVPNQAPTNWCNRPLFCFLVISGLLTGCGLKDDLTLPDAEKPETSLSASVTSPDTQLRPRTEKIAE